MAGRDLGAHQRALSVGANLVAAGPTGTSVTETQAVAATASADDGFVVSQVVTQAVLAIATADDGNRQSQWVTQAVAATATAASTALVDGDRIVTQAVSATASASYGWLPEFDEVVTTGTWSTPVTFAPGDLFIVDIAGPSVTSPRCRVSVQIEST